MRGASKESLARAQEALAGVTVTEELGTELFSVAKLLDGNGALRRALTDPARPQARRAPPWSEQLFGGKISAQALEILTAAVAGRWVSGRDLGDALDQFSVEAEVAYADDAAQAGRGRGRAVPAGAGRRGRAGAEREAERPQHPGRSPAGADPRTAAGQGRRRHGAAGRAGGGRPGPQLRGLDAVLPGRRGGPAQRQHRHRAGRHRPDRGRPHPAGRRRSAGSTAGTSS